MKLKENMMVPLQSTTKGNLNDDSFIIASSAIIWSINKPRSPVDNLVVVVQCLSTDNEIKFFLKTYVNSILQMSWFVVQKKAHYDANDTL